MENRLGCTVMAKVSAMGKAGAGARLFREICLCSGVSAYNKGWCVNWASGGRSGLRLAHRLRQVRSLAVLPCRWPGRTAKPPRCCIGRREGCCMSSCNGLLRLPPSTTYLPLWQMFIFRLIGVRSKMLVLLGLEDIKCHVSPSNVTICRTAHVFRVQEASGSNPDTPTKDPETAFAVSGSLIYVGVRTIKYNSPVELYECDIPCYSLVFYGLFPCFSMIW